MLSCSNNIFFALSDATLSIASAEAALGNDCQPLDGEYLEHGAIFNDADGAQKFDSPGGGGQLFWILFVLAFGDVYQSTHLTRMFHPFLNLAGDMAKLGWFALTGNQTSIKP